MTLYTDLGEMDADSVRSMTDEELDSQLYDVLDEHPYDDLSRHQLRGVVFMLDELLLRTREKVDGYSSRITPTQEEDIKQVLSGFHAPGSSVDMTGTVGMLLHHEDGYDLNRIREMDAAELVELREDVIVNERWNPSTPAFLALIASELAVRAAIATFERAEAVAPDE